MRREKIKDANTVVKDEFVLFDRATQVRYPQQPTVTDLEGFKYVRDGAGFDQGRVKPTLHLMLKDPSQCGEAETFHYSVIQYVEHSSNARHVIIFDTVAFICNDRGDTLEKVMG